MENKLKINGDNIFDLVEKYKPGEHDEDQKHPFTKAFFGDHDSSNALIVPTPQPGAPYQFIYSKPAIDNTISGKMKVNGISQNFCKKGCRPTLNNLVHTFFASSKYHSIQKDDDGIIKWWEGSCSLSEAKNQKKLRSLGIDKDFLFVLLQGSGGSGSAAVTGSGYYMHGSGGGSGCTAIICIDMQKKYQYVLYVSYSSWGGQTTIACWDKNADPVNRGEIWARAGADAVHDMPNIVNPGGEGGYAQIHRGIQDDCMQWYFTTSASGGRGKRLRQNVTFQTTRGAFSPLNSSIGTRVFENNYEDAIYSIKSLQPETFTIRRKGLGKLFNEGGHPIAPGGTSWFGTRGFWETGSYGAGGHGTIYSTPYPGQNGIIEIYY